MKTHWTTRVYQYRVRIEQEQTPMNPRKEFDNAGYMVCWHRKYDLGDSFDRNDPFSIDTKIVSPEWFFEALAARTVSSKYPKGLLQLNAQNIAHKNFLIIPLFLYDHSGISMSANRNYPFNCPGDSGHVGWIYFPKSRLSEERWTEEQAQKYLLGEVETYNDYLTGNVFGFIVERRDLDADEDDPWRHVTSCWRFFGSNPETNGMSEQIDPEEYKKADTMTFAADAIGVGI